MEREKGGKETDHLQKLGFTMAISILKALEYRTQCRI